MKKYFADTILNILIAPTRRKMEKYPPKPREDMKIKIETIRDIPYSSRDGAKLSMDIYKPESQPGIKYPVIVYMHGGGLIFGSKDLVRGFGPLLASKGYIVCAVEYRLVPYVRAYEDLADVSAGYDRAMEYISGLDDADQSRIYLAGESAGSFLVIYSYAMAHSKELETATGYKAANINIKAMALVSGMFYTNRLDKIGMLRIPFYGKGEKAECFRPFMDPENEAVIGNLPPSLLVVSDVDFLKQYSYDFEAALRKNNIECKLENLGRDKHLTHAFQVLHAEYPESEITADLIDNWFRQHQ